MGLAWVVTHPLRAHRDHHHERKRAAFETGREYGAAPAAPYGHPGDT
jgi:hypothetical protein